jgi:branched-chain amino acid transport system substrate-binding protein
VIWHGNTTMSVSATMRDAFALGLKADHIINNWGFDENLPRLAGEAAEGAIGATPCAFYGQPYKNMDIRRGLRKEVQPRGAAGEEVDPHHSGLGRCAWCSGKP